MLKLKSFTFNGFQENTYIVFDDERKEGVVIDPGAYTANERTTLQAFVADKGIRITAIWLTHAHIDHVMGLRWATQAFRCRFHHAAEDLATLRAVPVYASSAFGVHDIALPDEEGLEIQHGTELPLGSHHFKALYTPGHAPGHLAFYEPSLGVISGDALFYGSIGRTDLPGGDLNTLERSIQTQLYTLPDSTEVYPGHGPSTTIGREKKFNPFVRG